MTDRATDYGDVIWRTDARVVALPSNDDLMALVREKAADPTIFDDEANQPFFWDAIISNDQIDAYYTRMDPKTTLPNYAEDASNGVAYQDSHDIYKAGFGRSIAGVFNKGSGANGSTTAATFFTIPNRTFGGNNTTDMIDGMRAGLFKDVSVGFSPGHFECSICGDDPFDWFSGECPHIPGMNYTADGKLEGRAKGKKTAPTETLTLCYAWVMDGHLREVSQVYKGATPGAAVAKVRMMAARGEMDSRSLTIAERRFQIDLPRRVMVAVGNGVTETRTMTIPAMLRVLDGDAVPADEVKAEDDVQDDTATTETTTATNEDPPIDSADPIDDTPVTGREEADPMPENERTEPTMTAEVQGIAPAAIRALLAEHGIEADADPLVTLRQIVSEVPMLRTRAGIGDHYRATLIEETLDAGARAMEGFDRDVYKRILDTHPCTTDGVKAIQAMRRAFDDMGHKRFPGGRATADTGTETPEEAAQAARRAADEKQDAPIDESPLDFSLYKVSGR